MAVVKVFVASDMRENAVWNGAILEANATTIRISNGLLEGTYTGSFTYRSDGYPEGVVTGYTATARGDPLLKVTGASADAFQVAVAVQSDQATIAYSLVLPGADRILGSGGSDYLFSYGGNDTLLGRNGSDTLSGDGGADRVVGGQGNDTVLGASGSDRLFGNGGDDDLYGNDGADTIIGGSGSDSVFGGAGSDDLNGGGGKDTLLGEGGADTIIGGKQADFLHGGDGDDELFGGSKRDALFGGKGNDLLVGGAGKDAFVFSNQRGQDTINDFSGGDFIVVTGLKNVERIEVRSVGRDVELSWKAMSVLVEDTDIAAVTDALSAEPEPYE